MPGGFVHFSIQQPLCTYAIMKMAPIKGPFSLFQLFNVIVQ